MPEEALDKLFRPFYRIDDARGRQTGGVGLGLAITERAVRLHGGTVKASNRPKGGLQIEIRLPIDVLKKLGWSRTTLPAKTELRPRKPQASRPRPHEPGDDTGQVTAELAGNFLSGC